MDLFNKKIIGYSTAKYKNGKLVFNAFKTIPYASNKIHLFHTDRSKEFKTQFIYQHHFKTLEQLQLLLFDFVNWWNHVRYHGGLNYETPIQFKKYYLNSSIYFVSTLLYFLFSQVLTSNNSTMISSWEQKFC